MGVMGDTFSSVDTHVAVREEGVSALSVSSISNSSEKIWERINVIMGVMGEMFSSVDTQVTVAVPEEGESALSVSAISKSSSEKASPLDGNQGKQSYTCLTMKREGFQSSTKQATEMCKK